MHEFDTVSVSSYEAASLAGKLTEKSADGWDVVAIVPAGSEVTAYLRREATAAPETTELATAAGAGETAVSEPEAQPEAQPEEPAGWGSAPASTVDSGWGSSTSTAPAGTTSTWDTAGEAAAASSTSTPADTGSWGTSTTTTTPDPTPAPAPTPQVPPGWYADPSGRFELRYWDGSAWTEHVARQGQQFTDPPVA
jgi:hypothetical protein